MVSDSIPICRHGVLHKFEMEEVRDLLEETSDDLEMFSNFDDLVLILEDENTSDVRLDSVAHYLINDLELVCPLVTCEEGMLIKRLQAEKTTNSTYSFGTFDYICSLGHCYEELENI